MQNRKQFEIMKMFRTGTVNKHREADMKIWKVLETIAPLKEGYGIYTPREMLVEYGFADAEIIGVYDNREAAEKKFEQCNGFIYNDSIKGYILAEYEADPDDPETEELIEIIDISDLNVD